MRLGGHGSAVLWESVRLDEGSAVQLCCDCWRIETKVVEYLDDQNETGSRSERVSRYMDLCLCA